MCGAHISRPAIYTQPYQVHVYVLTVLCVTHTYLAIYIRCYLCCCSVVVLCAGAVVIADYSNTLKGKMSK